MSRKIRNFQKNLLIVCEGENSEPNYYGKLGEITQGKGIWDKIVVSPEPKILSEPIDEHDTHTAKRKTREFKKPITQDDYQIEDEYKSYPVRFVRQAQRGLEDETFEEVWAVFDKDYHAKHKEAFELADKLVEGKKVNIAFSSISFEHWILLHYERNKTAFIKSECKDENDRTNYCGCFSNDLDCMGEKCVIGYLKANGFISTNINIKGSQTDLYSLLSRKDDVALENASWLRHESQTNLKTLPIYQLNPITTNDLLLKRLKGDNQEIIWADIGEEITTPSFSLIIKYRVNLFAVLEFRNNSQSVIFNNQNISSYFTFKTIDNRLIKFDICETKVFRNVESGTIILRLFENGVRRFSFTHLNFKVLLEQ